MYRNTVFVLLLLGTLFLVSGCSSSPNGSSSSSLMGISGDPAATSLYKLSVKAGSLTVATGKSIPLVVRLTDFSGSPIKDVELILTSSLGGAFTDSDGTAAVGGKTDAGGFIYLIFTAGNNAGTTQITAAAFDAMATVAVQILPSVVAAPTVTVFAAADVVAPGKPVFIQIFVADANGVPLDKADVVLQSVIGGTFANDSGATAEGWYTTTMTTGNLVGQETITAMALGKTGSKTISVRN